MDQQPKTQAGDDTATSGSDTRPARELRQPLVLDVASEAQSLWDEPEWADRDRNSRTVATTERLRITLTALRAGAEIGTDATDDTLAIQAIRGAARVEADGSSLSLAAGQLATIAEPGSWRIRAEEDTVLLLTVGLASPPSAAR